ncbi:FtsX-like permease family protein [candidate division KSB1 bacterium]|nr:FtsX-like permease family protein [candidate division KSB1 bacterium]NIR70007.1 FtsX-like permease family protein [candidate division KSB1 bacterium]NIS24406.1 FtsX-like permease family protein [candidate division KSB1 bacterium]NIT71341.1 FtsX-like permease family protein [candidate division KSB1 bacterium]NIU25021.1 FtsX-like permease family protein [candidate division KSB1 bacterium]
MFRNYVKTTFRNIKRQQAYSFITITGLAIGIACCVLIFMFVSHELSYDNYHKDVERIYRIPTIVKSKSVERPFARGLTPLIPTLRENFPEVETAVRFHYWSTANVKVEHDNQVFIENSLMVTEPELFRVFTIPFLLGNPATALDRPGAIVITREIAYKIFPNESPLGKTLKVNGREYEITGVVENAPENTHLRYDIMLSLKTVENRMNLDNWGWTGFYSYVKLFPNVNPQEFEENIRTVAHDYIGETLDELGIEFVLFLQPLKDIHLQSNLHREIKPPGDSTYVYIFSVVGILILLVACINFMNLTTARSGTRAKEIGVRKVMGAQRFQLMVQFIGEFIFMTIIALFMALLMIELVLPYFNELAGKHFITSSIFRPNIIIALMSTVLFVGLIAGSYPALFLSAFKPVSVFQRFSHTGSGGGAVRKMLVVWQFAISTALIIGTLLIYRQIDFMKNKHLGFDKEQKVILPIYLGDNFETIKKEFLSHPSITGTTASSDVPGRIDNSLVTKLVGDENEPGWTILYNFVDYDFISEYGLEVIAGRPFQREMATDASMAFVLNEAAVINFGFATPEEALGKRLTRGGESGPIIGVVKNFHIKGLQSEIQPHIMQLRSRDFSMLSLTISTENLAETLEFIQGKWQELQLGRTFSYFFLDEDFNRQYGSEERMGRLFSVFTGLGIIIAVLGLFGLASFMAEQRTKEIGIRKVLGATLVNVLSLLSKDFVKLVLLANVIACPIAWYVTGRWLENFAYRIDIGWWIFVLAGGLALVIALLTVSTQAVRAALANPVESLRYE